MTIYEQITQIANQLANEGKKPTVALVKAKLTTPTPMPTIISTLKNWQHDPKAVTQEAHTEETVTTTENTSEIAQLLAELITPLKQEISALKEEVRLLREQLKQP